MKRIVVQFIFVFLCLSLFNSCEERSGENNHLFVDLGLSVKWATCNVGANSFEEYGDYFAWGEVEAKEVYDWSTYKFYDSKNDVMSKYVITNGSFRNDEIILNLEDDVAQINWGGNWRMPTIEEMNELFNNCTWEWVIYHGKEGYMVTSNIKGYTDRSIFLPAAGYMKYGDLLADNSYGYYASSSLNTEIPQSDYNDSRYSYLYIFCKTYISSEAFTRCIGLSVRPVCP